MSVIADDEQTGLFVTSTRIVELLAGLPMLLAGVALPVVAVAARDNPGRLRYVLQRMTEVAALLGVMIAVVTAFAAEPVIVALGGDQYRDAAPVLRIQAVALVTIFLAQAWSTAIVASGRQRALIWVTGLGLVAVIALGLALVPAFDAEGAALAVAIADAAMTAGTLVALRRAGPGRELSYGFVPRVALAGAVAALVPLALGLPDVAATLLACLLYAAAALVLRLVPGEVLDAARVRLRRTS
jgi:O-antigen/teichoic acid export membrane protein